MNNAAYGGTIKNVMIHDAFCVTGRLIHRYHVFIVSQSICQSGCLSVSLSKQFMKVYKIHVEKEQ